ncbi:hypothetical protein PVAP13_9KG136985 [Panicum virgatum]|uniref:Uncharacterized protein n=1 Tax=Panicum virgatum TaxID=38727 RepID=A0A8T0NGW6_PANVG|nr:hypothetical protein PVAP13_9KG136985 [Panicum virgatum]
MVFVSAYAAPRMRSPPDYVLPTCASSHHAAPCRPGGRMAAFSSRPQLLAAASASDPSDANSRRRPCSPAATAHEPRHATRYNEQSPSSMCSHAPQLRRRLASGAGRLNRQKLLRGVVGGQPHDSAQRAAAQRA